jgi:nucleotide-binding universal stress UspA family protein
MHVMVATDGSVDAKKAAAIASTLAGEGQVTVYTVVEVSRQMLNDMRASVADASDDKAREISVEYRTTQAGDAPISRWVGDDVVVSNYVNGKVSERTSELAAELEAAGVNFTVVGEEGENAARAVLEAASNLDVDVLCIGTRGLGRFDGLLGSLATKVARRASCSVVLVR